MIPQPMGQTCRSPGVFLADVMLGRLARWLRFLGYDTAYEKDLKDLKDLNDAELVDRAVMEDRWVLTRDRYLVRRRALKGRSTLLASDDLREQLRQLHGEINLSLTLCRNPRCPECNEVLEDIDPDQAKPRVPMYVAGHHDQFARCPRCARVFWPGTHWDHIRRTLERLGNASGHGKP